GIMPREIMSLSLSRASLNPISRGLEYRREESFRSCQISQSAKGQRHSRDLEDHMKALKAEVIP
ncbi:MAG: hypothetical protein ACO3FE_10480, partial [Planctomycetaceae bacterium]